MPSLQLTDWDPAFYSYTDTAFRKIMRISESQYMSFPYRGRT